MTSPENHARGRQGSLNATEPAYLIVSLVMEGRRSVVWLQGLCHCSNDFMSQATPQEANDGWLAALKARDVANIVDFLHDDYALVLVYPSPLKFDRTEWLRTLPSYVVSKFEVRTSFWDRQVDFATHLQLVDMQADVFGADRSGLFVITDSWLRSSDGAWRVWRRHSTPLSGGEMPKE
jgi:ketosteroid isomerase-like protein